MKKTIYTLTKSCKALSIGMKFKNSYCIRIYSLAFCFCVNRQLLKFLHKTVLLKMIKINVGPTFLGVKGNSQHIIRPIGLNKT